MVGWILLALFLMLVIGFLLIPINIYIDTIKRQYYVQVQGIAKVSIQAHEEEILRVHLRALFRDFYFYPLRKKHSSKPKRLKETKPKKPKRKIGFRKILNLLRSFKVKVFILNIDTGNYILNAKLYPVFAFLNYRLGNCNINFENRNQMVLYLQNRPIYILKSFINI